MASKENKREKIEKVKGIEKGIVREKNCKKILGPDKLLGNPS